MKKTKTTEPTLSENTTKNSLELRFAGNPGKEVTEELRRQGWRFTPWGSKIKWDDPVWYFRPPLAEARAFAESLLEVLKETPASPAPAVDKAEPAEFNPLAEVVA